jgi:hypothetical protein
MKILEKSGEVLFFNPLYKCFSLFVEINNPRRYIIRFMLKYFVNKLNIINIMLNNEGILPGNLLPLGQLLSILLPMEKVTPLFLASKLLRIDKSINIGEKRLIPQNPIPLLNTKNLTRSNNLLNDELDRGLDVFVFGEVFSLVGFSFGTFYDLDLVLHVLF